MKQNERETQVENTEPVEKKPKKRKGKIRTILVIAVVIAAIVLLALSFGGGSSASADKYSTARAEYRDIVVSVNGAGTIKPIHSGTIVGMVTGDILKDYFEIGDQVTEDQILYLVDAEKAQTSYEQAQLAVKQAQIAYDQALRSANDLTVKSTVSGQISQIAVKVGDTVSAGMPVATVTDNKNMTLECSFNSVDAKYVQPGQSAVVTITATGETVGATVKTVSAFTSVGLGGTLVQSIEFAVENPGGITGGMAATAQVGNYACQSGGTFEYATQTQILAKASGTVDALYVSEGTSVAPDTQVLHLDSPMMEDQVKNAEIAMENAQLNLRAAQDMLDAYQIKAPISGTVTQKDLSAGDNIGQVGTTVMAVISDLSALTFDMYIDELDIPKVKVGQTVEITVDALPGQLFSGYVDKININGVTANGVTSYPVKVMVENPDPALLPGMNVSAKIIVEEVEHALTVPLNAVNRGDIVKVLPETAVLEDGTIDISQAKNQQITVGANDSDYVEVTGGLTEHDLILIEGLFVQQPTAEEMRNELLESMDG